MTQVVADGPTHLQVIRAARVRGRTDPVDIVIVDGRIKRVDPADPSPDHAPAEGAYDAAGRVVIPAFVESHLHLDKALLGPSDRPGGLGEAIADVARRKAGFTADDIARRAGAVLRRALSLGTTAVRAQTEVDPTIGLLGVRAVVDLAGALNGLLMLRVVAFPQEGILGRPGTLDLLRQALELPGVMVGGCPYAEPDEDSARRHVDLVLRLADEYQVPADLHIDLAADLADPRYALTEYLVDAMAERGHTGRVAIGHATTLGHLDPDRRARLLDRLARAGVTVAVLPATDLFFNGHGSVGVGRVIAPVRELWAAGVPCTISSNNVRNPFTPTGRADLLEIALLLARLVHAAEQADFDRILDMATVAGRPLVGEPSAGTFLDPGAPADLVVLDADDPDSVIVDQPDRMAVIHGGRIVHRRRIVATWPVCPQEADALALDGPQASRVASSPPQSQQMIKE